MRGSLTKLGYGVLVAGALVAGSVFRVYGTSTPAIFTGCLTQGGTLINVSTQGTVGCPSGSSPVSWNQAAAGGGLSRTIEISGSQSFVVPAGVTHLEVEAWGGGGGGSQDIPWPDCISSAAGGSGGYVRVVIAVTPGETLAVNVGAGGAPGGNGGSSTVMRGSSILVSAGGGGGATVVSGASPATIGGAAGVVNSPAGGIVRNGIAGTGGVFDMMCAGAPGNPPTSPAGVAGTAIQGSVGLPNNGSAGGQGVFGFDNPAKRGGAGDVILTW